MARISNPFSTGQTTKKIKDPNRKKIASADFITPTVSTQGQRLFNTQGTAGLPKVTPVTPVTRTETPSIIDETPQVDTVEDFEKVAISDTDLVDDVQETEVTPTTDTTSPTILDIIRRQETRARELAEEERRRRIAEGTIGLQGVLSGTQAELQRQQESLDPRFGALKSSAVAGTRVAQKRLANLIPFSGLQRGASARQQIGLETALQGRQTQLDQARAQEEADIAFRGQQAQRQFDTGVAQLREGALADEAAANIRAFERTSDQELRQAQIEEDRVYQAGLEAAELARRQGDQETENTLSLALEKIDLGIPLNESEALAMGVQPGYVRQVPTGSTGAGLSQRDFLLNARFKIENGLPLTEQEATIFGVEPGFIDPNFDTSTPGTDPEFETGILESELANFVKGTNDIKFAASSWLVQNIDSMTEEQFEQFKRKYRVDDDDLKDAQNKIFRRSPSVGT